MRKIVETLSARATVFAGIALVVALLAAPAIAEVQYPVGSRIGLDPPAGITLNKTNNQFEDTDRKVSISVLDVPLQLYSEMEHMVFAQTNQPNVNVLKRESFPYAAGIGYFIAVELSVENVKYRKWLLLGQSNSNPVPDLATLVSFQAPADALDAYPEDVVRKTLASVTFRPAPLDERLGLMPFVIGDRAGFEITDVAPTGVMLTEKREKGAEPEVIVSAGQSGPLAAADRPTFARQLMERSPVLGMEITSAEPMRIGGMPGFEIKARGQAPNGDAIMLVQWLRFGGAGYIRIVGGASPQDWDQTFPRFRAIRDGVALR